MKRIGRVVEPRKGLPLILRALADALEDAEGAIHAEFCSVEEIDDCPYRNDHNGQLIDDARLIASALEMPPHEGGAAPST